MNSVPRRRCRLPSIVGVRLTDSEPVALFSQSHSRVRLLAAKTDEIVQHIKLRAVEAFRQTASKTCAMQLSDNGKLVHEDKQHVSIGHLLICDSALLKYTFKLRLAYSLILNYYDSTLNYMAGTMMKHVIGQSLFQIVVLTLLVFWGELFIP